MKKQRIIISSQNNPQFRGVLFEQQFDQRDGLAQVGAGDVVVTTNPIDPCYVNYWEEIGYSLPHLISAGPFDENYILSELILNNKKIQDKIIDAIPDKNNAHIEFFTVSQSERLLSETLGLSTSTNISFSERYQRKTQSKKLFDLLKINNLPYRVLSYDGRNDETLRYLSKLVNDEGCMFKRDLGTGGVALGGMFTFDHSEADVKKINPGLYVIEPMVEILTEISCPWYIKNHNDIKYEGLFEQIAEETSYIGVKNPLVGISPSLVEKIYQERERLVTTIAKMGGRGYMCCDIILTTDGNFYWSDLNPRKGAAIYIIEAVKRLNAIHNINVPAFYHKHVPKLAIGRNFSIIKKILGDLLIPKEKGYILITNPGVIMYGNLDITAVADNSDNARTLFDKALSLVS